MSASVLHRPPACAMQRVPRGRFRPKAFAALQPGDLVFYAEDVDDPAAIGHLGRTSLADGLTADEIFVIPDLTDDEWEAFACALNE